MYVLGVSSQALVLKTEAFIRGQGQGCPVSAEYGLGVSKGCLIDDL